MEYQQKPFPKTCSRFSDKKPMQTYSDLENLDIKPRISYRSKPNCIIKKKGTREHVHIFKKILPTLRLGSSPGGSPPRAPRGPPAAPRGPRGALRRRGPSPGWGDRDSESEQTVLQRIRDLELAVIFLFVAVFIGFFKEGWLWVAVPGDFGVRRFNRYFLLFLCTDVARSRLPCSSSWNVEKRSLLGPLSSSFRCRTSINTSNYYLRIRTSKIIPSIFKKHHKRNQMKMGLFQSLRISLGICWNRTPAMWHNGSSWISRSLQRAQSDGVKPWELKAGALKEFQLGGFSFPLGGCKYLLSVGCTLIWFFLSICFPCGFWEREGSYCGIRWQVWDLLESWLGESRGRPGDRSFRRLKSWFVQAEQMFFKALRAQKDSCLILVFNPFIRGSNDHDFWRHWA